MGHYLFGEGLDEGADVAGVTAGVDHEVGDADFGEGLDGLDHVIGSTHGVACVRVDGVDLVEAGADFPFGGLDAFISAVGEGAPGQEAPADSAGVPACGLGVFLDAGLGFSKGLDGGLGGEEAVAEASGPSQHALWEAVHAVGANPDRDGAAGRAEGPS